MKKIVILLAILCIALASSIYIGIKENNNNDPTKGCIQFKTFTEYRGYHCKTEDIYLRTS